MSLEEYQHHVTSGEMMPRHRSLIGEHLLPGGAGYQTWNTAPPRSALTEPPRGLLERAAVGLWDLCIDHRGAIGGAFGNFFGDAALSILHFAPHSFGWGLGAGLLGLGPAGIATIASFAHVANPPSPHGIATHHPGHIIGRIIGTAFGAFLVLGETAVGLLGGPLSAGMWVADVIASAGILTVLGLHHGGHRTHRQAAQTDRVRADTERIWAVAELTTANRTDQGAFADTQPGPFDHHPLTNEILRALNVIDVAGASVVALNVADSKRWNAVTNLPDGIAPAKVIAQLDTLQGVLKIRAGGLRLTKGPGGHQVAWTVHNVPLAQLPAPGTHPMIEAGGPVSIWDPIRLGLDDDGNPATVHRAAADALDFPAPGLFFAGMPGAGKSNASAAALCTVARAGDCELWTIDGSGRELVIFDAVAVRRCGPDMDAALRILAELREEITRRGEILKNARVTELNAKVAKELGLDCIALAIGELAFFTGDETEPKKTKMFNSHLRDIVSRGRACGVFGIYDTQKPEDRTVPSAIRDMVPVKVALRCETPEQVATILGRGMAKLYPAHEIDALDVGVAYVKGIPGRKPFRIRTHKITPEERYAIVDQCAPADQAPPEGPTLPDGGGQDEVRDAVDRVVGEHARAHPVRHLELVREDRYTDRYPDGTAIPPNHLERWRLLFGFQDGFLWRDLIPLQVENGKARTSWQDVMALWEGKGWVVRHGRVGNATLYIRADLLEEGRADGRTA